jgi:GNAT superfamily N-acetyltransferase
LDYHLERVTTSQNDLIRDARLLATVFPTAHHYSADYLKWEYAENPDGDIVGFNAFTQEGDHAAHYVAQPMRAFLSGKVERGLLSLNTATHPAHQGRGLFTRLGTATYALARQLGYTFVVGVANANSTPGFVGKLGFQLARSLDARIGLGTPVWDQSAEPVFRRAWSADAMAWRLSNPHARYYSQGVRKYANCGIPTLRMQIAANFIAGPQDDRGSIAFHPFVAWIGAYPNLHWRGIALPVPSKFRPSPLNFIFKDLTDGGRQLASNAIYFEAIDFDAY